jgi:hypothetical protein
LQQNQDTTAPAENLGDAPVDILQAVDEVQTEEKDTKGGGEIKTIKI